jgi:hypothetical protein
MHMLIRMTLKAMVAASLAALLLVALLISIIVLREGDPFDKFEVIRVNSGPGTRHAVIYQYYHADSSNRLIAIWIIAGSPPSIGATETPRGSPAVVWTGLVDELVLTWSQGHLSISAPSTRIEPRVGACYFEEETRILCFDPKAISIK